MAKAYLLTNDGSGEDGDEWLLKSIHATKEGADAAKTEWYRSVEEWEIKGSLLTDAERYAVLSGLRALERQLWSDRENLGGEYRDLQRDAARIRGFLQRVGGVA